MKRAIVASVLAVSALAAQAEDNVLTWDATSDVRAQNIEIERCAGTTMQCSAAGAPWQQLITIPMPAVTYTDQNRPENTWDSYRARYSNVDQGGGAWTGVVSKRVPFGGPPTDVPANFNAQ